jgi:glycine hydroxymethyltransferase
VTSGIRVGTPAVTTRGFKEAECVQLTNWICDIFDALEAGNADEVIASVKTKVAAMCKDFPVYAE